VVDKHHPIDCRKIRQVSPVIFVFHSAVGAVAPGWWREAFISCWFSVLGTCGGGVAYLISLD